MTTRAPSRFGYLLRQQRTAAALSQEELAERAGLSARALSDLERGVHQAPRLETVRLLAEALDLRQPERAELIAAARPEAMVVSTAIAAGRGPRFSMPLPPTPLVGRESEVAELREMLTRHQRRLVTLTGPGGTGKTRLAQAVATGLLEEFPDGVVFVDLAPITDPDLVLPRIVAALDVRVSGDRPPLNCVTADLEGKRVLLLLDNFEHLLSAAPVAANLLATCAGLHMLVTSRAPLRLRGEQEFSVQPLRLPDVVRLPTLDLLAETEAVALFVQCAQAARADFELTPKNARTLAEICVRLDGLPLAIELAATRIRVLPLPALLARLEHRLPLLTEGARDLPARQQTLGDAIAWSYDLLSPGEQQVFRALAVFAGGATLDALEAVAHDSGSVSLDVLTSVTGLVEQNLLRQEEGPEGEPRFRMLETIREFALQRLTISAGVEEARRCHAAWCLQLAERLGHRKRPALMGNPRDVVTLEAEYVNLRSALTWLTETGDASSALRLAAALGGFWNLRGHLGEGRSWLEQALERDDGTRPRERSSALLWLAMILASERSFTLMDEAQELAQGDGDMVGVASAMVSRAFAIFHGRGDAQAAISLGEASLVRFEEADIHWGVTASRLILAKAAQLQGNLDEATARYEQLAADFRERGGDQYIAAQTFQSLGSLARIRGEDASASSLYAEALHRFNDLGDLGGVAWCLEGVAGASGGRHPEAAARLFAAADALRALITAPLSSGERPDHDKVVASIRSSMGESSFELAWSAGVGLSLDSALAEATLLVSTP